MPGVHAYQRLGWKTVHPTTASTVRVPKHAPGLHVAADRPTVHADSADGNFPDWQDAGVLRCGLRDAAYPNDANQTPYFVLRSDVGRGRNPEASFRRGVFQVPPDSQMMAGDWRPAG